MLVVNTHHFLYFVRGASSRADERYVLFCSPEVVPPVSGTIGEFTVRRTEDWEWDKEFNVQLAPAELAAHPSLSVGDEILVKNPANELEPGVFGRIDEGDHLEAGEVAIGFDLRHAVGVPRSEDDPGTVTLVRTDPPETPRLRRFFDRFVRFRPIMCRVRYAVHPDIGFAVCRLSEETFDVLGIEPGDRVVLQSEHDTTSVKALPAEGKIEARKSMQKEQNPDRYPDCRELLDIEAIAGTRVDLPRIYLDAEMREHAGLDRTANGGVCQPVKVYRDSQSFLLRKLNGVAIPAVGALLGFLVVFEDSLSLPVLGVVFLLTVLVILLSVYYRVRVESLD